MTITRVNVMGTPVDNLTMDQTLDYIQNTIETGGHIHHSVVNAGKIVLMHENAELRNSVINADLINADGQAVVWASQLLGTPIIERVTGISLMQNLVAQAAKNNYGIFFFGAKQEVLEKMVAHYRNLYPDSPNLIAGYRNGYFKRKDERGIAEQIAASGAQILFVAITSPIKENFLYRHRDLLNRVNFIMGVGGSFDVVAGLVKRAPMWMQKTGLEWLYRVYQEPRRMFRRYLVGNTKFIGLLLRYRFGKAPIPRTSERVPNVKKQKVIQPLLSLKH